MNKSKIRGVFFDAGNTLLRVHPSIGDIYSEAAAEFGVDVTPEQIENSFKEHWKNTLPLVSNEGHRLTYEKERDWWRYIVREVFQAFVPFQNFESFFDHLYIRFAQSDTWRLYDDVSAVLEVLKERDMKLAIVSNWDSRLPSLCDQLGITPFFHALVVSSLVGYEKPHPAIFQIALERTQLSAREVLYIGDDPFLDYQAAQKADLNALHLDRNDRFPDHPDKVTSLHQVLDRV
jgi:putative hydrolase of the HAD superfamily